MTSLVLVAVIAVIFMAIAFAAIGIKMFVKKDGKFEKSCGSVGPNGERIGCTCGSGGDCDNEGKKS